MESQKVALDVIASLAKQAQQLQELEIRRLLHRFAPRNDV
jgi:hypothetical protein